MPITHIINLFKPAFPGVEGPIYLDLENVRGDTVSDRKYHGGIDLSLYNSKLTNVRFGFTKLGLFKTCYPEIPSSNGP